MAFSTGTVFAGGVCPTGIAILGTAACGGGAAGATVPWGRENEIPNVTSAMSVAATAPAKREFRNVASSPEFLLDCAGANFGNWLECVPRRIFSAAAGKEAPGFGSSPSPGFAAFCLAKVH